MFLRSTMTLADKQMLFMKLLGEFLVWIYQQPSMAVTGGQLERSEETARIYAMMGKGIANTLHTKRLAIDLNLFIAGVYMTSSDAYKPLGQKWKSMHPLCRWGGDFSKPDGNHFSLEHEGVR